MFLFFACIFNAADNPGAAAGPMEFSTELRILFPGSARTPMKEDFSCIAVDMGAGSIRVMLGVLGSRGISYREVHRMDNRIIEAEGHDRWDMQRITSEIRKGISMAMSGPEPLPGSIGVDSWGVDFVHLDGEGHLLEDPVAYRDSRTEGMQEKWRDLMPELETFVRTGINFYRFNTLYQLLSLKGSGLMERSTRILFLPSYLNYLLTGTAANELTIASTSQMLRLGGKSWDEVILEKLGIGEGLLGKVIDPGTKFGPVILPEGAGRSLEGIAVCGHDTACVVAAVPSEGKDFAYLSAGTWCIVGIESEQPLISREALELGFTNERAYNNKYRTLKNIVGLWLLQGLKKQLPDGTGFGEMERMTRLGGELTQVIDPEDPLFYHPEDMKAAFDAFFTRTGQPLPREFSDYVRCAYDSLCFSFRYHVEKLEELSGRKLRVLHVVGGGSQSDYLNQRIADICGRRVVAGPVECAALGNILVQAVSMGLVPGLAAGRAMVRQSFPVKTYEPGPSGGPGGRIRERYDTYLSLKQQQNL
jgi:rhamnulokinase